MRSECKIVLEDFKSFKPDVEKVGELLYHMQIDDEDKDLWSLSTSQEKRYRVFKEIRKFESFSRNKRQWISRKYYDKLADLFQRFPAEHSTIRKALRISNSTYYRLLKESKEEDRSQRLKNRTERSTKKLSKTEKTLVALMIRPPTSPLTLNEI